MKEIFQTFSFKKLSLAAGLALSLLIVLTIVGYFKIRASEDSSKWVKHTLEVLSSLETLNASIYKLGNAQKFYIISGTTSFKNVYSKIVVEQDLHQQELTRLVSDNEYQSKNLDALRSKIRDLVDYYDETVNLVANNERLKALQLVNTGRGVRLLDEVTKEIQKLKTIEEKLLSERLTTERTNHNNANNIILTGTLGGILTVLGFIFLAYMGNVRREQIQAQLNRNAQVQRAIVNAAAYALIATDREGKITNFNPAAEALLGYNELEVLGHNPAIFHDSTEVGKRADDLSKRFDTRIPVGFEVFKYRADRNIIESDQWTYIRKDGSKLQVRLTVTALRDVAGEINGYIGVAYDLTQQLEFEHVLTRAREDALAGTKAKSEFLANMSHEIRTPMNAIMGMAELLNETDLNDDQRKYVNIFQNAGASLLNIINDILDLSKIEAGHFELDQSPVQLTRVVSAAAEIMAVKAHQKELELIVDQDEDLYEYYHADGTRIRQILLNLLGNAVKFTKQGEVILKVYGGQDYDDGRKEVIIEVMDTGIGMTEEQLKKLFERFSQADSSITKEFGGTGLGLSITRKLVDLMEGSIDVQSTYGIGTRFRVSIKLKVNHSPENTEQLRSLVGLNFLIVDDNKTNRLILKKMLENKGATTREAENGVAAWYLIQNNKMPFDLILIDGRMPQMDGFSLAEKILTTEQTKKSVLMMLTSDTRPGDIARSKKLGVKSHLVKPILKYDLLQAIDNALQAPALTEVKYVMEAQPLKEKPTSAMLSILLVDDNDENRVVVKEFLKSLHASVDEAKNGREALNLYQAKTYDLILMDMQMPIMDGYSAVQEIRKLEIEGNKVFSPIVALSAFALKEEIQRSYETGCNAHLTKPIAKKDLLAMIEVQTGSLVEEVPEDMSDLIPDYLNNRRIEVVKASEALQKSDYKSLQSIGHKLAGSAGSYGLKKLTEIGRRLEEAARLSDQVNSTWALSDYKVYLRQLKIVYVVS